jgi:hypothetical protein
MNALTAMDLDLLGKLRALEVALNQPVIRGDPVRLKELLHPRFHEFGRSGREYSRDDVIAGLVGQPEEGGTLSQDYRIEQLSERLALLTYRSAHFTANGALERYSLRASLWELTAAGWQLRFHQGTPTEAFEAQSDS